MAQPLVHVLVINWNGLEHLQDCFASLLLDPYENVRYVLVDNGSDDGSAAFVRDTFGADPRVEVLELHENLGWSGGNNRGMERALEAGAEYVFLLNNDIAADNPCVSRLVEVAEAHPEAGCLAPRLLMFDAPEIVNSVGLACSVIGGCWDIGLGRLDGPKWRRRDEVIGACGGAAFYRTASLRKSGLLPREFGIYLDDLDLSLRTWNAGYSVLSCPEVALRHKFSATMGTGDRMRSKYFLNVRNRAYVMARNYPMRDLVRYVPDYVIGECRAVGRAVLDGEYWKLATHAQADAAALAYLPAGRRAYGRHGAERPAFRRLLKERPLFFPGAEFPVKGWYAERKHGAHRVRPISRDAEWDSPGGPLRVTLHSCYPRLGPAQVDVSQQGKLLASLDSETAPTASVSTAPGTVRFEAKRIFDADDTGERADFGGWLEMTGPLIVQQAAQPARQR